MRLLRLVPAALVLVLPACGGGGEGWQYSATSEARRIRRADAVRRLDHQVPEGAGATRFRIRMELEAGRAEVEITDPDGRSRWRRELDGAGELAEDVEMPAEAGTWRLTLELVAASGRYDVRAVNR